MDSGHTDTGKPSEPTCLAHETPVRLVKKEPTEKHEGDVNLHLLKRTNKVRASKLSIFQADGSSEPAPVITKTKLHLTKLEPCEESNGGTVDLSSTTNVRQRSPDGTITVLEWPNEFIRRTQHHPPLLYSPNPEIFTQPEHAALANLLLDGTQVDSAAMSVVPEQTEEEPMEAKVVEPPPSPHVENKPKPKKKRKTKEKEKSVKEKQQSSAVGGLVAYSSDENETASPDSSKESKSVLQSTKPTPEVITPTKLPAVKIKLKDKIKGTDKSAWDSTDDEYEITTQDGGDTETQQVSKETKVEPTIAPPVETKSRGSSKSKTCDSHKEDSPHGKHRSRSSVSSSSSHGGKHHSRRHRTSPSSSRSRSTSRSRTRSSSRDSSHSGRRKHRRHRHSSSRSHSRSRSRSSRFSGRRHHRNRRRHRSRSSSYSRSRSSRTRSTRSRSRRRSSRSRSSSSSRSSDRSSRPYTSRKSTYRRRASHSSSSPYSLPRGGARRSNITSGGVASHHSQGGPSARGGVNAAAQRPKWNKPETRAADAVKKMKEDNLRNQQQQQQIQLQLQRVVEEQQKKQKNVAAAANAGENTSIVEETKVAPLEFGPHLPPKSEEEQGQQQVAATREGDMEAAGDSGSNAGAQPSLDIPLPKEKPKKGVWHPSMDWSKGNKVGRKKGANFADSSSDGTQNKTDIYIGPQLSPRTAQKLGMDRKRKAEGGEGQESAAKVATTEATNSFEISLEQNEHYLNLQNQAIVHAARQTGALLGAAAATPEQQEYLRQLQAAQAAAAGVATSGGVLALPGGAAYFTQASGMTQATLANASDVTGAVLAPNALAATPTAATNLLPANINPAAVAALQMAQQQHLQQQAQAQQQQQVQVQQQAQQQQQQQLQMQQMLMAAGGAQMNAAAVAAATGGMVPLQLQQQVTPQYLLSKGFPIGGIPVLQTAGGIPIVHPAALAFLQQQQQQHQQQQILQAHAQAQAAQLIMAQQQQQSLLQQHNLLASLAASQNPQMIVFQPRLPFPRQ